MGSLFSSSEIGPPPAGHIRVHARLGMCERKAADGNGGKGSFGLHVWGACAAAPTQWDQPLEQVGEDWFGPFFDIPVAEEKLQEPVVGGTPALGVMLHRGDDRRATLELASADLSAAMPELWFGHGAFHSTVQLDPSTVPTGDLGSGGARAHWLKEGLIVWRAPASAPAGSRIWLQSSAAGALVDAGSGGVQGCDTDQEGGPFELHFLDGGLPMDIAVEYPYLVGCAALSVPPSAHSRALCRRQLAVTLIGPDGDTWDCTGVQLGPLIDELFAYTGPLGCFPTGTEETLVDSGKRPRYGGAFRRSRTAIPDEASNGVTLALWAPTAQDVSVIFFDGPQEPQVETLGMERSNDGVWRARGPGTWWGRYYVYSVKAYHPQARAVVTMQTPDPYSKACSADAERTLACHLPTWSSMVPDEHFANWRGGARPAFADRGHAVVYELHIRDFSATDETVTPAHRGKYLAFEEEGTVGDRHLRKLAAAGVTHVQLLPSYDFGTVPEREENRREPRIPDGAAPDSELQQEAAAEAADTDGFNWGYDPVLYDVPEGSYATDPDGGARVLEHRRMVAALHAKGLRVVLDVVYNHTLASGPEGRQSVLDKCVPAYYHRRSENGAYENSTCMNNTAAERKMMGRLVVDGVLHWTKEYLVDGFRFDLMGHLPLEVVQKCRASLDELTVEKDGVDGQRILLYGEGWEFGECANDQRIRMAVQRNLASTRVGSFNDRIRDAVLGGSPFVDPRIQGFATGLALRPWPDDAGVPQGAADVEQRRDLAVAADKIRISLAASLGAYRLQADCTGAADVRASEAHGGGVAYTGQPEEIINYVSAHDNESLYDNTVWKMSPTLFTPEERMRANWLCTAIVAFAHGIPFFHAGDEVLRSKSLDRDSYNSGDWFNLLDFSGKRSAFGTGLPSKAKNHDKWDLMRPLLRDASLRPTPQMVAATTAKFCENLRVRRSTPLLGLTDADDVLGKVVFPGCGADQELGLIVMQVRNGPGASAPERLLCTDLARVVVVFNGRFEETRVPVPPAGMDVDRDVAAPASAVAPCEVGVQLMQVHPLQAKSEDAVTRTARVEGGELVVPPQAAIVFVELLPGRESWMAQA